MGLQAGSALKNTITGICRSNRWSYGVFWSFDQRNSTMLTSEDIYFEEQVKMVAPDMLQQVHMLGEGVIGMAAFTGKHRWIFSDREWNSSMLLGNQDIVQDNSEFQLQFSCGIKTVAVIPVHPQGVLQLGSTQKIFESSEFLVDTKRLLCKVINDGGQKSTSMADICHFDELLSSLISSVDSDDWSLSAVHNDSCRDFVGKSCASTDNDLLHFSTSSCEPSVLTSSEPLSAFDIRDQDDQYPSCMDFNVIDSCKSSMESEKRSLAFASLSTLLHPVTEGEVMDTEIGLPNFLEEYLSEDFIMDLPDISSSPVDDLFQWFGSSLEHGSNGANKSPVVSSQSSVTHVSHSNGSDKRVMVTDAIFNGLGSDFGCCPAGKARETIITEAHGSYSGGRNGMSASTPKLAESSSDPPRKRLFWELGIEELLDGISNTSSITKSCIENQSSASKRTRMERSSLDSNQIQLVGPCMSMNLRQTSCMVDKADDFLCKKEVAPKPQVSSWIDDSYSTNVGGEKGEEPAKVNKKRARPGESSRPRPKDRQQIQDRIKELRGIIPNGAKCSIDSLLDRTIKYMLFLQSVTKYADKLNQSNKPKLIDQENGAALNDKCTTERGGGGITWAFKVGSTTPMVCPVIVEDLSSPGQMLVEMLCEERGFFLEIADMIRSCGLTILKGVMEIRDDKIWAQFVVEVKLNTNQSITRINVFLSLMELLQQTNNGATELEDHSSNVVIDGGGHPVTLPIPISLAETFQ